MPRLVEPLPELGHHHLLPVALGGGLFQVADRGDRACGNGRRDGGGEDEPGCKRAHEVDQLFRGGDIPAQHAERLAQRAFDHREPVHQAFALGDAAAARAVKADAMHFVEIGHCAVLVGDIADLGDRGDIAIHGIDRFKRHQLGPVRIHLRQAPVQIFRIIVGEDVFFSRE
jgi:hypothetical protein